MKAYLVNGTAIVALQLFFSCLLVFVTLSVFLCAAGNCKALSCAIPFGKRAQALFFPLCSAFVLLFVLLACADAHTTNQQGFFKRALLTTVNNEETPKIHASANLKRSCHSCA